MPPVCQDTALPLPDIALVVAMTRAGVIGAGGKLPWALPDDRRLFRQLTTGHTVIMGRRTFAGLEGALPNRHNIVVSRSRRHLRGATCCRTLSEAISLARRVGKKIFVVGGVELYREALPLADTLHISWIEAEYSGDRHFPPFDLTEWQPVSTNNHPGFKHIIYRRTGPTG